MKIIDILKEKIFNIKVRKKHLLPNPDYNYANDVIKIKERIISSIPANITQMEKAYYIYLELGKILYEDPINAFGKKKDREELSNKKIDNMLHGNCKAIAELYVSILNDERVGIKSELLAIDKENGSHVDTVLYINGKQYIANLISDLSRIKTHKKVKSFCFDFKDKPNIQYTKDYKEKISRYYKKLAFLTKQEMEQLDKRFGYSYIPETEKENSSRGLYTEDVFERIGKELEDHKIFEKYVLKGKKDLTDDEILKCKLQFFFENMHKFSTYNGEMRYLENIRYYFYTLMKFFTQEEKRKINIYACTINNDFSNIYSIIKLRQGNPKERNNTYFIYDKNKQMYVEIDKKDLVLIVNGKEDFKIIGEVDHNKYIEKEELEL